MVGSTGGYDEILTATYTGWVFGMTTGIVSNPILSDFYDSYDSCDS